MVLQRKTIGWTFRRYRARFRFRLIRLAAISCSVLALHVDAAGQAAQEPSRQVASPPGAGDIDLWYGTRQVFGSKGRAQRWVNVLGNVRRADQVKSVQFRLNGGEPENLSLGSDRHRLAASGDFNVELPWEALNTGENTLLITRTARNGRQTSAQVRLVVEPERTWPLPYYVNFAQVSNLLEAVQVVDGHWQLTGNGVRTRTPYYDRVLSAGDTSWKNYEATVRLTVHGFTPSAPGPPTYDVTHFGLALRWRGHKADGLQPSRQWFPLGAQGEFLLRHDSLAGQWRILMDGRKGGPVPVYAAASNPLVTGKPMLMKGQVRTMGDGRTRYRFKQWLEGTQEPLHWDVESYEEGAEDYSSGALCLVPHNSDVTIHELRVEPLSSLDPELYARPGPGAIHFSAPLGGLYGARGQTFVCDFIPAGAQLRAIQVNYTHLLRGLRFRIRLPDGTDKTVSLGNEEGQWQEWFEVAPGTHLTGISGASGWYIDGIQFHFTGDQFSPYYYTGRGGDTIFRLELNKSGSGQKAWLRGFFGTFDSGGIETLGLIFDPMD